MFESLGRGFKMILASVRMGWEDKRLLYPSMVTVLTNFIFGILMMCDVTRFFHPSESPSGTSHHLLNNFDPQSLAHMSGLNGSMDQSGFGAFAISGNPDAAWAAAFIAVLWWLVNRYLEGVTTAMVYSHLTEGPGSGKFSIACQAVLASLPAIILLGFATFLAKKVAGFLKNKASLSSMGLGGFLAQIVQVFWTLAGHLILPAIVIEGSSFFSALKRADKIASGNLLTIGFGEVGIDYIADMFSYIVGAIGVGILGFTYWQGILGSTLFWMSMVIWFCAVVVMTAVFMYIRSAFYTCLYVWAIEAETVTEIERHQVTPPAPLAHALA